MNTENINEYWNINEPLNTLMNTEHFNEHWTL